MSRISGSLFAPTVARKRVLLVDGYATKRDLRSKIMRRLGVDVDCASDIAQARALWQADSYSLVLVDVHNDAASVQEFCDEVRSAKPPQSVAFLVGKPEYLAESPASDNGASTPPPDVHGAWGEMVIAMYANACVALPRRYGFQEASWRIAATRSLKDPRPGHAVASAGTHNANTNKKHPQFSWVDAVNRHSEKSAS
jgi:CheY-like chemotaxis protein